MASARDATQGPGSRSSNACERCRQKKVKCSGDNPCRTCLRQKVTCSFTSIERKLYSEAYVKGLVETVKRYEQRIKQLESGELSRAAAGSDDSIKDDTPVSNQPSVCPTSQAPSQPTSQPSPIKPSGAGTPIEQASGPAFESRVRSLFHSKRDHDFHQNAGQNREAFSSQETAGWFPDIDLVVETTPLAIVPDEEESRRLLDLFLSYHGTIQHFMDPRAFSDSLGLFFQSAESRKIQESSLWYTQYLLVIAMGKLMDQDTASQGDMPGAPYFSEAMRRIPAVHRLGRCGVLAVEILCLATAYLKWCNRRRDAYLFSGTAVRLALALGCSLKPSEQQCLPSERAHRTRVWWTAYMLDRRLSANLGLPPAVDSRQISLELPTTAPGFRSSQALNVNVRLAHTTGEIMGSLYSNTAVSESELVPKIQSILQSLHDIEKSIPQKYALDFESSELELSRTSATLYLILFQAVVLCIRPVYLQRIKAKVEVIPEGQLMPEVQALSESCTKAATRSIRILAALERQGQLARFGFFDLDAAFWSAFILVMNGFVDNTAHPATELGEAGQLLSYLAQGGNKTALQRLEDIMHLSQYVWDAEVTKDTWQGIDQNAHKPYTGVGFSFYQMEEELDLQSFDFGMDIDETLNPAAPGPYPSLGGAGISSLGVDSLNWAQFEELLATRPA
ncbi:fungal-specific transcription factor domain-containing protein [Emericellopsis atlantica]|uniref:Fungal-specific transcription factor domain-containing protein n=1 Tax=Emericellopsis atlantica TaxID=2614577 RepID=A0A9P8CTP6_9HYPO|nr:fungal-specific transcription factor domain-containing protein [Emericellopsis atlantica]KAG9258450.1 fungal-specific transcription factor domain-containing protein [Emericellopsis atlantica]